MTLLAELLEQVRTLTKPHGAKVELAKDIGVRSQRITEWLSLATAARKPCGEMALRMDRWVRERQEARTRGRRSKRKAEGEATYSVPVAGLPMSGK